MRVGWLDDQVYDAAARFRDRCLLRDGSLFRELDGIATPELFEEIEAVIAVEDYSQRSYIEKLVDQVRPIGPQGIELAASLLFLQLLGENDVQGELKTRHVEALLGLLPSPPSIDDELLAGLHGGGVATFGAGKTYRDAHTRGLSRVFVEVKRLAADQRAAVMDDPWAFQSIVAKHRTSSNGMALNACLHLLFPDTFDSVVATSARAKLLSAFASAPGVAEQPDDDRRIARVRELVDEQLEYEIDFYTDPLINVWIEDDERADEFAEWCARLLALGRDFDVVERDYKLEAAERVAAARDALLGGEAWLPLLKKALTSNNLTNYRVQDDFLKWCAANLDAAADACRTLWVDGHADTDRFLTTVSEGMSAPGARISVMSVLLLADPDGFWPPYRATLAERTFRILRREWPPTNAPDEPVASAQWNSWVSLNEEMRLRLLKVGVQARDLLDPQGAAWWMANLEAPKSFDARTQQAFDTFRGRSTPVVPPPPDGGTVRRIPRATPELASELLLPEAWLQETLDLLEDKRQLILYGPPGTGKTFIAQHLGRHISAAGGELQLVQFHPSYTYEDFFEGYRPVTSDDGQLLYELRSGPLKDVAERAAEQPDVSHLLIIDEINRGNLAKIFGELYFLLEYRDRTIRLQYSRDEFQLPPNLLVLGTMNSADRSIALVDHALRRRFAFRELSPLRPPVAGVLRAWLERQRLDLEPADLLEELNRSIEDPDLAVGPSYFIRPGLGPIELERIWRHEILPLLREYHYGRRGSIEDEYGLDVLRARLAAATEAEGDSSDGPSAA